MLVELYTVCDILSSPDKTGLQKIIKKNVLVKREFDNTKTKCEEYIDKKGIVSKTYTNVYEEGQYFKVKGSYESIKAKLREPEPFKIKGFLGHVKGYTKG